MITTPLSFVATSNCILYSGAQPFFVDIDYKSGNICPKKLNEKISELKTKKKRLKLLLQ